MKHTGVKRQFALLVSIDGLLNKNPIVFFNPALFICSTVVLFVRLWFIL
jgi:hypothetical protein